MLIHPGQMFGGVPTLRNRRQMVSIYFAFTNILKTVDVRALLGLEARQAPWIMPLGLNDSESIIVQIIDANYLKQGLPVRMC
jgi:hypothetical protein